MNKRFIISNLEEAKEELEKTITKLKNSEGYSFENFHVGMAHAFHHMNSAWNGRNISDVDWRNYTQERYHALEKFPPDCPMIGDDGFYDLPDYKES